MTAAPRTFTTDLPCPRCGTMNVIGFNYVDEHGRVAHTRYVCTFWRSANYGPHVPAGSRSLTERCDWMGWSVPGWDTDEAVQPILRRRARIVESGYRAATVTDP